jgi:hypothetical protein
MGWGLLESGQPKTSRPQGVLTLEPAGIWSHISGSRGLLEGSALRLADEHHAEVLTVLLRCGAVVVNLQADFELGSLRHRLHCRIAAAVERSPRSSGHVAAIIKDRRHRRVPNTTADVH